MTSAAGIVLPSAAAAAAVVYYNHTTISVHLSSAVVSPTGAAVELQRGLLV